MEEEGSARQAGRPKEARLRREDDWCAGQAHWLAGDGGLNHRVTQGPENTGWANGGDWAWNG